MASALASPPPPLSFGSSDLKANARKFLERALVISALIHLSAVGAFRVAEDRAAARAGRELPGLPPWEHPVVLSPPISMLPPIWRPVPPANPDDGTIVPIPKGPILQSIDPGTTGHDPIADPGAGGDPKGPGPTGPGPGEPPDKPLPVFKVIDTLPLPLLAPKPAYPDWAREAGVEGRVLLRVLVGTDGFVKKTIVESGPKGLDQEAANAVRRWTFRPGLSNGQPVEVWVEVPVLFRL